MQHGEYKADVIASKDKVAVVMTQDWCPRWTEMQEWIYDLEDNLDIDIYELIYNKEEFFDEFRKFKESKWKNELIPYVRYYINGKLIKTTNNVSKEEFLKIFDIK